ncbi:hypothetical protein [Nereida sp. MMG025]|uniref:hypothetical protein n=1 Tax=Nereida sp. MMG025 TaxID=2909981 RepID=UPI001F22D7E5|nr:hypothetical protein [Nereida sp. MMG025]MCF6443415.1 hypothetical protein [Nereida sp. MMG025]
MFHRLTPKNALGWAGLFWGVLSVFSLIILIEALWDPESYYTTDFAIKYVDGFARRGLGGEVLYFLSDLSAIPMTTVLTLLLVPLQAVFLWRMWRILRVAMTEPALWPLVLSPVMLIGYSVTQQMGHKEILILPLLAAMTASTLQGGRVPQKLLAVGCLASGPIVLVHEGLIAWLLFLPALAALTWRDLSGATRLAVLVGGAGAGAALLASLMAPGTPAQGLAMCILYLERIGSDASQCPDFKAFTYFGQDSAQGVALLFEKMNGDGWLPVLGALVYVAPLAFVAALIWRRGGFRGAGFGGLLAAVLMVAMIVMTASIMMVAVDWGRFVSLVVIVLGFLTLIFALRPEVFGANRVSLDVAWITTHRNGWGWLMAAWALSWAPSKVVPELVSPLPMPLIVLVIWGLTKLLRKQHPQPE